MWKIRIYKFGKSAEVPPSVRSPLIEMSTRHRNAISPWPISTFRNQILSRQCAVSSKSSSLLSSELVPSKSRHLAEPQPQTNLSLFELAEFEASFDSNQFRFIVPFFPVLVWTVHQIFNGKPQRNVDPIYQTITAMNLIPLLLLAVAGASGSQGQAVTDDVFRSSRALNESDVVDSMRSVLFQGNRPSDRHLFERFGKPGDLFSEVIATGKLPSETSEDFSRSPADPDIFGALRAARKKEKSQSENSNDYSGKRENPYPSSLMDFLAGGESTAQPSPNQIDFDPYISGKGKSEASASQKGSEKRGKGERPGSTVSMFSNTFPTPSHSLETYGKGSGKGAAGFYGKGSGKGAPGSYGKGSGEGATASHGKGSGKSSKGSSKGKGGMKWERSSKSEKNSGKGSKGGKKKGGKGKGRSKCHPFEFNVDRRRLQFDGANCGNEFLNETAHISELSSFLDLVEASGLSFMFSCAGPFTMTAPINGAFDEIDLSKFSQMELQDIVLNHVFPGVTLKDDIQNGVLEALNGAQVITTKDPLQFNDAKPIQTDILGCNFVAHTIDALLVDLGKWKGLSQR